MIELPLPPHLTLPPHLRDHHSSANIPPHKPWATPGVSAPSLHARPRHAPPHFIAITAHRIIRRRPTNHLAPQGTGINGSGARVFWGLHFLNSSDASVFYCPMPPYSLKLLSVIGHGIGGARLAKMQDRWSKG